MQFGTCVRVLIGVLLALFGVAAAYGSEPRLINLDERACTFYAPAGTNPFDVIGQAPPNCDKPKQSPQGRVSYAMFAGLSARALPGDPLEFSHRLARADHQRVFFRYADGVVLESLTVRDEAVRPLAPTVLYFQVPVRAAPLTTILVRAQGYENRFGLARRAELAPLSENLRQSAISHLAYGLFGGAIIAMVLYNLLLWRALRHPFILLYAVLGLAMLGFGASWSGLAHALIPGLTVNQQVALNFLFYAVIIAVTPAFLAAFLEPNALPQRLKRITAGVAGIAVAASFARLLQLPLPWQWLDVATHVGITATIMLMAVEVIVAFVRRSRAVVYFVIAWAGPLAFSFYRTFWAAGIVRFDSPVMDVSPMGTMAFALVMSAVGVAARIEALRQERDDAQAMRAMLQHLTDTDPQTGLMTRSAFIAAAEAGEGEQGLVLFEIDDLQRANAAFGPDRGNWILAEVGRLLTKACPVGARIGRLAGEEFAMIGPPETVTAHLAAVIAFQVRHAPMPVRYSVVLRWGHATGSCADDVAWRAVYRRASQALETQSQSDRAGLR